MMFVVAGAGAVRASQCVACVRACVCMYVHVCVCTSVTACLLDCCSLAYIVDRSHRIASFRTALQAQKGNVAVGRLPVVRSTVLLQY
jgi:hypothetical protein